MTKTDTQLHRWALLDKNGKTRGTLTSPSRGDATRAFLINRGSALLPPGYLVVDRGPVEPTIARRLPIGQPIRLDITNIAPRPFQVGDKVRRKQPGTEGVPVGTLGTIGAIQGSWAFVAWDNGFGAGTVQKGDAYSPEGQSEFLKIVEPAPQPKAEEPKAEPPDVTLARIREATGVPFSEGRDLVEVVRSIASQMDRHRHERDEAQGAVDSINEILIKHQGLLHDARQEIATLKAEVERLGCELADAGERVAELSKDRDGRVNEADLWKRRWRELDSKLDDIQALHRVMSLAKASPADEWDFTTLLADVLNR